MIYYKSTKIMIDSPELIRNHHQYNNTRQLPWLCFYPKVLIDNFYKKYLEKLTTTISTELASLMARAAIKFFPRWLHRFCS